MMIEDEPRYKTTGTGRKLSKNVRNCFHRLSSAIVLQIGRETDPENISDLHGILETIAELRDNY